MDQSFIFRLIDDFHQPRPQHALRNIEDHTALCVNQYSLIVLNNLIIS